MKAQNDYVPERILYVMNRKSKLEATTCVWTVGLCNSTIPIPSRSNPNKEPELRIDMFKRKTITMVAMW